ARAGRERRGVREPVDEGGKLAAPIELWLRARRVEVAMLGKRPGGLAQGLARIGAIAAALAPAQRPPHAFARCHELALEPGIECLREERIRRLAGGKLEEGIDLRLDRP